MKPQCLNIISITNELCMHLMRESKFPNSWIFFLNSLYICKFILLYLSAGPDHMTMYIVPHSGIELVDWSIDRGHPTPVSKRKDSNETLYFVYYSHGIKPDKPWQFYLDFKVQVNEM